MNISCVFSWDLTFPSERGRVLPIFCGNLTHLAIREAFEKTGCAKFDPVGKLSLFIDIFDGGGIVGLHPPNKFIFGLKCQIYFLVNIMNHYSAKFNQKIYNKAAFYYV